MRLEQNISGVMGGGEMKLEMNPWVLAQIIQQGRLLQKTGAEFEQHIRQQVEGNMFVGEVGSNASKHDQIKEDARQTDEAIDAHGVIDQLKKSELSQEQIDIFLEVLAEKYLRIGLHDDAIELSKEITNQEIRDSIETQIAIS